MSLCLTIMDKDNIYMGADSATSTIVNGDIVRVDTNARKIFDTNDYIIFCCGKVDNIRLILQYIKENKLRGIEDYLRSICNDNNDVFEAELLTYDKTKRVLYTFSQYNRFNKVEYKHPKDGIQILTSGYRTKEAFEIAKECIQNGEEVFDIFKDTYTKLICNGIGGNVVVYSNITHMRMFPLIDTTTCINIQGLDTYFINGEVICGQLVLGNKLVAKSDDGVVNISGNLISIYDKSGNKIVDLGEYASNTYGLMLYDDDGNVLIGREGLLNTYQDTVQENVDYYHPLILRAFIPENTKSIYKAYVRITLENFRAYSRGAKSSAQQTRSTSDGGYRASTTSSSPSQSRSTDSGGGSYISESTDVDGWWSGTDGHDHGITPYTRLAIYDGTEEVLSSDGKKKVSCLRGGGGWETFVPSGQHKHDVRINIPNHSHEFTIPSHSHGFEVPYHSHEFTIPSHSHDIEYGIYEGTRASNVYLRVNNTLVGGAYNSNMDAIEITPFLAIGAWNTITLSSTTLGRINASIFVQALMGAYK